MTLAKSSSKQDPEIGYMVGFVDKEGLEINEREHPDAEARFAMQLLSHHGVLMGTPDGEDSAGRAKLDYLPPSEVVGRALDIAQTFYEEARKRGCMIQLPSREEIRDKIEEARERQEREKAERIAARQKAKENA